MANRRMKLAEEWYWIETPSGPSACTESEAMDVCLSGKTLNVTAYNSDSWCPSDIALAVIDAAGLDKVRVAARELRDARNRDCACDTSDINTSGIRKALLELCCALDEETETS